ncbi:tRNA(Phe) 7-((3-amino-3-carboxypropyl)-4-demethylwyosine(37)-N(4))-methyltransferase [Acidianus manzaensis]|uniref:tRNA(Phe) 7-((3-amino-3-carboxypropyl)-4-demethylwyosine(37)-N(4))-methyltransferase n=1 Tax=Acidianus manzaensis TaxID=282676 RepID=A0A1W6K1B4_9CREN|nr:hypothetical protein [Acidianus manzaensis]ARM76270.1 hypothetical protein B6F84_09685 [Acidianus manzaensis]
MMSWEEWKKKAYERMLRDQEIGYLDPDIFDVLMAFFNREKSFTYSSCSGRITIVDSILPWVRNDSTIVFKNHLGIKEDDIKDILQKDQVNRLWLISQGPILHVYTKDWDEAWEIIKISRQAGFKHSGILTTNKKGILVELRTGVKFVHLLRENSEQKVSEEEIKTLTKISNEVLMKGKEKLNLLKDLVSSVGNDSMQLRKDSEGKIKLNNKI